MTQVPADYLPTTNSYNYEQPLPSVARTSTVTKVLPAKKITFFKSGDPQFAGVKMAINQRSFKSFNALMDDLSHRVPLPFGVRTITTPRGIHCISELDQLEDGGCYLCSDKKYVKPIGITSGGHRPAPPRTGRPSSTVRRVVQEGKLEDSSAPFTQHGPRLPKKITLVKNGESGFRRSIILNRRNARSFKTLLDEISEILQFPVKKLYTVDGNKIDSMQALLHCPNTLVCVGREPFKPVSMENLRKHSVEKLPDLTPRSNGNNVNENNEMNFGLKAKKSVIHPRSSSSNRSTRFSLSSEKSYPNGLAASPDNGAPFLNTCSHPKPGDLVHSLVNDDIEKRVHVNEDGSLSVEMKVRFRLLNDETLQWSTQIKKSNLMNQMPCEESGVEDSGVNPIQKMNPEVSSEADESSYPCDIDSYMSKLEESECDEAHCHNCGKKHHDYDIWKNPMHSSHREEPRVRSTWHTRSSCSSTSSRRRIVHKKMSSVDSLHTTSSEEFSEHIVQESSSYSETIENRVAYRSSKKCTCQSDLSTGASNGEDQQEHARTSTSHSQRHSSLGLASHSSCENNLDTQDAPEDHGASKTNSQNEDENRFEVSSVKCLKDDVEEVESIRVGSAISRSSLQTRQSQKNICEETSSVGRSISSSSLQKVNQDDNTRCSTPANSVHSKSSKRTTPRAKSEQDVHSDDNALVSSFSSESCPKKEAENIEAEQEENEINEVSSVSAKTKTRQSARDEGSEGERCSTHGTPHSRGSDRNSKRSDSDEIIPCNASCSSRGSKKSKHSHIHLDAQSEMSVSSLESTLNKKNNSLHADDLRSCSRASNHSKSSCEVKKKSIGDPMSHNSGSFHSNISSTSEAEAIAGFTEEKSLKSVSNAYSASSKGSKKRSHREENSKPSSICSSVSSPNGQAAEGNSKINSEARSSRHGSISESVCSKGDLSTETKIRNGNPASVSSRISSKSEVKDTCLLAQISQESDDRCSQSNVSQSSKSRQMKTKHLRVKMSNSSRASLSETLSVCSLHCPTPPKGKPKSKNLQSTALKDSSVSSIGTGSVLTTGKEQKKPIESSIATSYGSKSVATEVNDQKNKEIDDSCSGKVEEDLEGMSMQEEGSDLMPSTLPNTSPEEVVQEWLSKIPSETLLMKYEMQDDAEVECIEATTEVPYCTNAKEITEDEKAEKKNMEEDENEAKDEVEQEIAEGTSINEEAEECMNQEQMSEVVSEAAKANEAECSQSVTSSQNNNRRDLPTSVQTSVQIMKALLSSKHETKFDRSNSLPEVSPTMGRKLSNSANILITCLASLQLLDEESEDPSDKSKHLNKTRYMELLNIFQALWSGCTSEKSGPSSSQEATEQAKTVSGFKAPKSANYNFTPMSSSGVDVSSGSGGSGEEITAGARDCTLMAQKTAEFKSAGQVAKVKVGTELTETKEQDEEKEQPSQPLTACSKSKGEEKAQPTREDSPIQEAEENKGDQCSSCENAKEEERENENEKNSKIDENGEQEEPEAVNDELLKENLAEKAAQLTTTDDTHASEVDCGTELKADLEKQLEKESPSDPEPKVDTATSVGTSLVQQNSMDPDPIWVLRLLKKIEKEFMAHYVSAMNDFKVRWNLQDNQQMDEMILELKEEVSKRIQKSIEKELRKIKMGAGKIPRPPDEPLKRELSLQTEQRRRRLKSMHKKSFFSDKNGTQSRVEDTSDLSLEVDENISFSATFEASISKQKSEEEYCPCDSCVRKKMASKPTRNPVVATNAPVMKAFDLQQILRLKKNDNDEACVSEAAQDTKTIPSSSVKEAAENGNPNEENDEGELQPSETEVEGNEEKQTELNGVGSSTLKGVGEGSEISESQNCEMEDEVKDEEAKEEKEEEEEVGEKNKEREEEEEEEKDEEEEEEEIMNAEEEETKEKAKGETKEKEDEEVKEEIAEETKEEEEIKDEEEKEEDEDKVEEEEEEKVEEEETKEEEEGETKEEEEEVSEKEEETEGEKKDMNEEEEEKEEEKELKEEEEETKEEEEGEVREEEEETKEEEEDMEEEDMNEEEEGTKDEEEDMNEEEEETKDEEEDMKEEEDMNEEEEGTKDEEEDMKEEEEETKDEEEEDMKEEEEETKDDEEEDMKEEEEETKDEEEDMNEEEEEKKDEEEDMKEEEEGTKEEADMNEEEEETKDEEEDMNEEEEEKKDEEEDMNEEEEEKKDEADMNEEEEGTKDEEEDINEEEEEKKDEEEEMNEEEEGTKEEADKNEEEEETKDEEEDMNEEEEETKDEEEDIKDKEDVNEEEEETKDEEEVMNEEEEMQEEEEATKEDEEAKKDEEETKQEEQEVEEEEENPKKEEEEAKEEKDGEKEDEDTKEEEEKANEEEEEQEEEIQTEEQEAEEKLEAEDGADNEAEEAEEPEDEDLGADDEEETCECKGDAGDSGTNDNPEGHAAEGSEEAEQDEVEAVGDANPESEDEACSAEQDNNSEGGDKCDECDEEPTSDDPDKAHETHEDKGNNETSEKASKAKCKESSKRLETLNKATAFSCYSSMGNLSQQSQKGSEDEGEEECKDDNNSMKNHSNGEVQSDESSKPSQMYPDSEEEEDKASSCTDPLGDEDQADAEDVDPKEVKHTAKVQASKKKEDSDEIDQDDLDF